MYNIEMHEVSDDFARCLNTGLNHIQSKGREAIKWLKCDLVPPFLDHASFRIGNQLFFLRIEDIDESLETPSNPEGLKTIANGCNGIACHMPMKRKGVGWEVVAEDWGLIDPNNKTIINPFELVTDENILMTDWEIQDFAVQVVRNYIKEKLGFKILSSQGNPSVYPSLWFAGKEKKECVVVSSSRFGEQLPQLPLNINDITKIASKMTDKVYFAPVFFFHPQQKKYKEVLPLYRGHETGFHFSGLERLS